jgi:hypothetical protein
MKKKLKAALIIIPFLVIGFLASVAFASGIIQIVVNGNAISSDVPPQIINGSTMVPVRVISEALGASVSWDSSTQTVTLLNGSVHIAMTLGGYTLENGSPITLDNPAQLINGRVMVPIRFIATAFGCQVNWDANNQTVEISSNSAEPQTSSSTSTAPEVSQPSAVNPPTVGGGNAQQWEQIISQCQQNIANNTATATNQSNYIHGEYDPQIQLLEEQEQEAIAQVPEKLGTMGMSTIATQQEQEVKDQYDTQIQQLQNEEQYNLNNISQTLQEYVSSQQQAIAQAQAALQQLNSGQ